jgi:hypothetical protein
MASTYGYITAATLENFTGIDYSIVDSVAYSDARVEVIITSAEEIVNGLMGVSTAQTVTNAITISTKFLSAWMLWQSMANLGYTLKEPQGIYLLTWDQILNLVQKFLNETGPNVEGIPMSGANATLKPDIRTY